MVQKERYPIDSVFQWINRNGHWNHRFFEVKKSKNVSGWGVFLKEEADIEMVHEKVMLRIPKENILSCKNSAIYNLLDEYMMIDGISDGVDLTKGIHGLVISCIYEVSYKEDSPWYEYLKSFYPSDTSIDDDLVPLCLWPKLEKQLLKNTQCDVLGMLDSDELLVFYLECIKFARTNEKILAIPSVLNIQIPEGARANNYVLDEQYDSFMAFGRQFQAVLSRAFYVDDFHGMSLVPGADLFNHISVDTQDIQDIESSCKRADVQFFSDSIGICEVCGGKDCDDHSDEEDMGEEEEDDEDQDDEEQDDEEDMRDEQDMGDKQDLVEQVNEQRASSILEEYESGAIHLTPGKETIEVPALQLQIPENSAESETDFSEQEMSTVEDEAEQDTDYEIDFMDGQEIEEDLKALLTESTQCCDMVILKNSNATPGEEVFSCYGKYLSNPFLLQQYGFVNEKSDPNLNDFCMLGVELIQYIKTLKNTSSKAKNIQLETKLEWYQNKGFDIINEIVLSSQDIESQDEEYIERLELLTPQTWQASPCIEFTGKITPQTFAILSLLTLPFQTFESRLLKVGEANKQKRAIYSLLLPSSSRNLTKEMTRVFDILVASRKSKFSKDLSVVVNVKRREIIDALIANEICILEKVPYI